MESEIISNENFDSDTNTEDSEIHQFITETKAIVTCSVHHGIFNDPRQLSCQHVFCYKCLENLQNHSHILKCPICRFIEPSSNIARLPLARTENRIIDMIMKCRINNIKGKMNLTNELTNEDKKEVLEYLLKDKSLCKNNDSNYSSREIDKEKVKEEMKNNSIYLQNCKKEIYNIYKNLVDKYIDVSQIDFSIFDIKVSNDDFQQIQIVFLNSSINQLIVYTESQTRIFYIRLDDKIIKPEYIRIHRDHLLLTGRLQKQDSVEWIFIKSNLKGDIVQKSDLPDLSMMLGFDINIEEDLYYICMSQTEQIRVYNDNLTETICYDLDNKRPEYIAYSPSQKQLWISCPQNHEILIFYIELSIFETISTGNTIPQNISLIDDEKILFLDAKNGRIVWIKKADEDVFYENIYENQSVEIKSFQVCPFGRIFIGLDDEMILIQSKRHFSTSNYFQNYCTIL